MNPKHTIQLFFLSAYLFLLFSCQKIVDNTTIPEINSSVSQQEKAIKQLMEIVGDEGDLFILNEEQKNYFTTQNIKIFKLKDFEIFIDSAQILGYPFKEMNNTTYFSKTFVKAKIKQNKISKEFGEITPVPGERVPAL